MIYKIFAGMEKKNQYCVPGAGSWVLGPWSVVLLISEMGA